MTKPKATTHYTFFAQLLYNTAEPPQTQCRVCCNNYPKGQGHTCPAPKK